jgi:streptomycin 6-kinase
MNTGSLEYHDGVDANRFTNPNAASVGNPGRIARRMAAIFLNSHFHGNDASPATPQ